MTWCPDDSALVFFGIDSQPFKLGKIHCNNRPSIHTYYFILINSFMLVAISTNLIFLRNNLLLCSTMRINALKMVSIRSKACHTRQMESIWFSLHVKLTDHMMRAWLCTRFIILINNFQNNNLDKLGYRRGAFKIMHADTSY